MASKSFKKLKREIKKKKLITSRLMGISLLVDDYIYKNKPISLLEAEKIYEEITSLKLKCKQDTRSLQVVDKLKLFMRSIIKENQQSIDRLQDSTRSVTEPSVINNPLTTLNVIPEDVENTVTNNTTTELFSNRETQYSEINHFTQDINTQKKISINITSPVISVSNREIKPVEFNITTANNSTLKVNKKSHENIEYVSKNIDFDKPNILANLTNETQQAKKDSVMLTPNLQKHTEKEKKCLGKKYQKSNEITSRISEEKQTKVNKKTRTENKATAKKNFKTKTKKVLSNEPEKMSSSQSKKKLKGKTQINLSWVENIKFVREVSTDEHTDLQIEDSFWNNLILPGSWDSNDFD